MKCYATVLRYHLLPGPWIEMTRFPASSPNSAEIPLPYATTGDASGDSRLTSSIYAVFIQDASAATMSTTPFARMVHSQLAEVVLAPGYFCSFHSKNLVKNSFGSLPLVSLVSRKPSPKPTSTNSWSLSRASLFSGWGVVAADLGALALSTGLRSKLPPGVCIVVIRFPASSRRRFVTPLPEPLVIKRPEGVHSFSSTSPSGYVVEPGAMSIIPLSKRTQYQLSLLAVAPRTFAKNCSKNSFGSRPRRVSRASVFAVVGTGVTTLRSPVGGLAAGVSSTGAMNQVFVKVLRTNSTRFPLSFSKTRQRQ